MPTLVEQSAGEIRMSRAEFARLFDQEQLLRVDAPVKFDVLAGSAGDLAAFTLALEKAEQQGWLTQLLARIAEEKGESGKITEQLSTGNARLQAVVNAAQGFDRPEVAYKGIASAMRWTVKVMIDNAGKGTGVLVGPHLVLTAWHVVRGLFAQDAAGVWKPDAAAGSRLKVEFDDFVDLLTPGAGTGNRQFGVHQDWCVVFSPCHQEELNDRLPADLAELSGFWDYAVIRLAGTPGHERQWAVLNRPGSVPEVRAGITVFQHPLGNPMRFTPGAIAKPENGQEAAIPSARFLHIANSAGGSSGGPCFNQQFELFGLHQGEWRQMEINRGVPLAQVKQHMGELPMPGAQDSRLWKLGDFSPVVGCDGFQDLVWRAAMGGSPRLILLFGDGGRGKSFRLKVLKAMLPDSGHMKVELRADVIAKKSGVEVAEAIAKAAGTVMPTITAVGDFDSTGNVWLRDELLAKLMTALEAKREGRMVWVMIEDLNKTDVSSKEASELLHFFYEQAKGTEWLRFVLDGMKGDPPLSVRPLMVRHKVQEAQKGEIGQYLRRAIASIPGKGLPAAEAFAWMEKLADRDFEEAMARDSGAAMAELPGRLQNVIECWLEA